MRSIYKKTILKDKYKAAIGRPPKKKILKNPKFSLNDIFQKNNLIHQIDIYSQIPKLFLCMIGQEKIIYEDAFSKNEETFTNYEDLKDDNKLSSFYMILLTKTIESLKIKQKFADILFMITKIFTKIILENKNVDKFNIGQEFIKNIRENGLNFEKFRKVFAKNIKDSDIEEFGIQFSKILLEWKVYFKV